MKMTTVSSPARSAGTRNSANSSCTGAGVACVSTGIKRSQFHRNRRAPLLCLPSRVHTTSMTIRMTAEGVL
jgi:hypothetical protein